MATTDSDGIEAETSGQRRLNLFISNEWADAMRGSQIVTYIGISHPQLEQASSSILDVVTLARPDLAELGPKQISRLKEMLTSIVCYLTGTQATVFAEGLVDPVGKASNLHTVPQLDKWTIILETGCTFRLLNASMLTPFAQRSSER